MTELDPPRLEIRTEFLFRIEISADGKRIELMNGSPYGGYVKMPLKNNLLK